MCYFDYHLTFKNCKYIYFLIQIIVYLNTVQIISYINLITTKLFLNYIKNYFWKTYLTYYGFRVNKRGRRRWPLTLYLKKNFRLFYSCVSAGTAGNILVVVWQFHRLYSKAWLDTASDLYIFYMKLWTHLHTELWLLYISSSIKFPN